MEIEKHQKVGTGKIIILFILSMVLMCNSGCFRVSNLKPARFNPGSEPNGFREMKWGSGITALNGMEYLRMTSTGVKVYAKMNDDLKMQGINIEKIEYGFLDGKFFDVDILTKGYINWFKLKKTVFKKFGGGRQNKGHSYVWAGDKTVMFLSYNKTDRIGYLSLLSVEVDKEFRTLKDLNTRN